MWLFELGDAFLSAFKKTGMDRRAGAEAEANRGQVRRGRATRGSWIDKDHTVRTPIARTRTSQSEAEDDRYDGATGICFALVSG